ncbi:NBR1-Ig-like domain-containing protein [Actinocorallia longicatena]|uniref:Nbr1 FW domain-containing protein n=1 Tax=Actinocorallia longicatena TaxID=111803 RepID=A0ABP6QPS7_9ACTN
MGKTEGRLERERFAAELRELRVKAGNPSFRTMAAAAGRTVSHATLHEAAAGTRFPSWTTTRAFVAACGGDEQAWFERWQDARDPAAPVEDGAPEEIAEPAAAEEPGRWWRGWPVLIAGAAAVAIAAVPFLWPDGGGAGQGPKAIAATGPTPTELQKPLVEGDGSRFVADRTIPDGTVVKPNERFTKVWEIANVGTIFWKNRYLERISSPQDNGTCSTPGKVPIPDTPAGTNVLISVPVTAPASKGSCWVAWKMIDGRGRPFLPASRPIFFTVVVSD